MIKSNVKSLTLYQIKMTNIGMGEIRKVTFEPGIELLTPY